MYAVTDNSGTPQLMDVYLAGSTADVTAWSNSNFERHYNGTRQPFGIYVHPSKACTYIIYKNRVLIIHGIAHLTNYPGGADTSAQKEAVVSFIQSLQSKPNVWFVSNEQLLQWVAYFFFFSYLTRSSEY